MKQSYSNGFDNAVPSCHPGTRWQCASLVLCSNILRNTPLRPRSICGAFVMLQTQKGTSDHANDHTVQSNGDEMDLPLISNDAPPAMTWRAVFTAIRASGYVVRNIFLSCAMEYAVPGLVPYICRDSGSKTDPSSAAFWFAAWCFAGSTLGRVGSALYQQRLAHVTSERLNTLHATANEFFKSAAFLDRAQPRYVLLCATPSVARARGRARRCCERGRA